MTLAQTNPQIAAHIGNATGKLGFLKWVEAAFPASISVPVLKRAQSLNSPQTNLALAGLGRMRRLSGLGRGRFGALGQADGSDLLAGADDTSGDTTDLSDADAALMGQSVPDASTVATSTPASSSWITAIGGALTSALGAATTAYSTVSQINTANEITQTNLQRAAEGLPPLATTTGLAGTTILGPATTLSSLTPLLLIGGLGIAAVMLFSEAGKKKK